VVVAVGVVRFVVLVGAVGVCACRERGVVAAAAR
jgi:hypothetical protein